MQIAVLGMHRSGTSAATRLVNMMGAYVGTEEALLEANTDNVDGLWAQNRKGFWERKDVVDLNDEILQRMEVSWNAVAAFDRERLLSEEFDWARKRIHKILSLLEVSRPWVVKDPRMCLTWPLWAEQLEVPVVVYVWRNPLEVAASLKTRNGYTRAHGVALWEAYNVYALAACADMPVHVVEYGALMKDPVGETKRMCDALKKAGVKKLRMPGEKEIAGFLDPTLHHEHKKLTLRGLPKGVQAVVRTLRDGDTKKGAGLRLSSSSADALERFEKEQAVAAQRRDIEQQRSELQEQRDAVAAQLEAQKRKHDEALKARKEEYEKGLAAVKDARDEAHNIHAKQMQELKADCDARAAELKAKREEFDKTLSTERESHAKQLREVSEKRDSLARDRNELQGQVDALIDERAGFGTKVAALEEERAALLKRVEELEARPLEDEFKQVQARVRASDAELRTSQAALHKNQQRTQRIEHEHAKFRAERDEAVSARHAAEAELAKARAESEGQAKVEALLRADLDHARNAMAELEAEVRSAAEKSTALLVDLEKLRVEHTALKDREGLVSRARDRLSQDHEALKQDLAATRDELEQTQHRREALQSDLTASLAKLDTLASELKDAHAILTQQGEQYSALKRENERVSREKDQRGESIHALEAELREEKTRHRELHELHRALKLETERLEREKNQRGERTRQREADLRAHRRDAEQLNRIAERLGELFQETEGHWWWRMGLRLRRLASIAQLKRNKPTFPYDRAKPLVEHAQNIREAALARPTEPLPPPQEAPPAPAPVSRQTPRESHARPQSASVGADTPTKDPARSAELRLEARRFSQRKWTPTIDIVVAIHNAHDDVRRCLESIVRNTEGPYTVIAVNDGSDNAMREYLDAFARVHAQMSVVQNDDARGYTVAANQGLKASTGDFAILLNSDTIVPRNWLAPLIECAQSRPNLGILGPLSNAASFQSVPERKNAAGDWAINELPVGFTVDDMAALVRTISLREFPSVPFVNGFCYMISRAVIETIGYLDEATFPHGYGEENDYSLRARDAGFDLAIADHAYVFHAKSKSFGHERRQELSRAGYDALKSKHGSDTLAAGVSALELEPVLIETAAAVQRALDSDQCSALVAGTVAPAPSPETHPATVGSVTRLFARHADSDYARYIANVEQTENESSAPLVSAAVFVLAQTADEVAEIPATLDSLSRTGELTIHLLLAPGLEAEAGNVPIVRANPTDTPRAINDLVAAAETDYIAVLRGGDRLSESAHAHLSDHVQRRRALGERLGAIIVDSDELDSDGTRVNPFPRPGWSPALLMECDYIGTAVWLNSHAMNRIGGFADLSRGYLRDALLRLDESGYHIEKLDRFDFHFGRSASAPYSADDHAIIERAATRRGLELRAVEAGPHGLRPVYDPGHALASIIVPFKDKPELLRTCVSSILEKTQYDRYEILLVDNQSEEPETLAYLEELQRRPNVRIVPYDRPFNYSRLNNHAATHARGDVLVFLNNDTEVITPEWLGELVADAVQPGVGSVGALLHFAEGTVQHAGVVVGLNGLAGHLFAGMTEAEIPPGYLRHRREVSANTAACLAIRKEVFDEVGRFNEEFLVTGNDVELGLRIRDFGYRNVFNPRARLYHYEKSTRSHIRVKDIDIELSLLHYQPYLDEGDPYFNASLDPNDSRMTLTDGQAPAHVAFRDKWLNERKQPAQSLSANPRSVANGDLKLPDEEVVVYDVTPEIMRANEALMQRFYRDPHLELNRVLWFVPHFDHVYRGGIYTIFRTAAYFSERAGTQNTFVLYGHRKVSLDQISLELKGAFPNLNFELREHSPNRNIDDLPESDAAFSTLWNSAYYLVRYNKCRAKFSFLQDYEPGFYPAGTVFGLIEATYRFGFIGVANTPGVAEIYRGFNPWVEYFVPAVDRSIYRPSSNGVADRPRRVVFYGRPANSRNAFRLGIEALKKVKAHYGDDVEIVSAGAEFDPKEFGVEGVIENRGVLGSLDEVAELYRSSDIGLVFMFSAHPSYQPFEFMASGCVTVTNDNPRNHWFLKDGENALVVEPTVSCVASKIVEALEDPELRARINQGGLDTVAGLNWEDAMNKIYEFVRHPHIARENGTG